MISDYRRGVWILLKYQRVQCIDDILDWNIGEEGGTFYPWEVAAQKFFDDESFNDKQDQTYKLIDNSILYAVKKLLDKGVDSDKKFLLDFAEKLFNFFCDIKEKNISDDKEYSWMKQKYCFNDPLIKQTYCYCVAKLSLANHRDKVNPYLAMLSKRKWIHTRNDKSKIINAIRKEILRLDK